MPYNLKFIVEKNMADTNEGTKTIREYGGSFSDEFLKGKGYTWDTELTEAKYNELKEEYEKTSSEENDGETVIEVKQGDSSGKQDSNTNGPNDSQEVNFVPKAGSHDEEEWIKRYETHLKAYAIAHHQVWKREFKDENGQDIPGLKGSIGEAQFYFTSEDKVMTNTAGIEALVSLARQTGQDIAYNENWSNDFRSKMEEACRAGGVLIQYPDPSHALEYKGANNNKGLLPHNIVSNTNTPLNQETTNGSQPDSLNEPPASQEKGSGTDDHTADHTEQQDSGPQGKLPADKLTHWLEYCSSTAYFGKDVRDLENEIRNARKQKAKDAEDEFKEKRLLLKYVYAIKTNNPGVKQQCLTALQYYDIDQIKMTQAKGATNFEVTTKPYNDRTSEEKAKIKTALQQTAMKDNNSQGMNTFQQKSRNTGRQ